MGGSSKDWVSCRRAAKGTGRVPTLRHFPQHRLAARADWKLSVTSTYVRLAHSPATGKPLRALCPKRVETPLLPPRSSSPFSASSPGRPSHHCLPSHLVRPARPRSPSYNNHVRGHLKEQRAGTMLPFKHVLQIQQSQKECGGSELILSEDAPPLGCNGVFG